jgi:hypothetical protein
MKRNLLLLLGLICTSSISFAQDVKLIKLLNEKTPVRVQHYHITAVRDDRADTSTLGIVSSGLLNKKKFSLNLQNGVAGSLRDFIHNNVSQDTATAPIELHISHLLATQTGAGIHTRTDLSLTVSFFIKGEKISHFSGSGYVEGGGDVIKPIEEMIRKNLQNGMLQFDEWWLKNKDQYYASKGAPRLVAVNVQMEKTSDDPDVIVYASGRPLQLTDFEAKPDDLSMATAITNSGMLITYDAETMNGEVKVLVHITPYFDKARSWYRNKNGNAKTLLHEQKHFEITFIKACELMQAIRNTKFTANYVRELDLLNRQKQKECDQMQADYDAQTKHGQIMAAQQKWNKLIEEELLKITK